MVMTPYTLAFINESSESWSYSCRNIPSRKRERWWCS